MRRFAVVLVFVLGLMLLPAVASAAEAFYIPSYDIQMDVREDNSYAITETIEVRFTEQRHGIYRKIPVHAYFGDRVKIRDIEVAGQDFKKWEENAYLYLQIGDEDRWAAANTTYTISYTYRIGDDRNKELDELYFNLIGNDWDCNINKVSFDIRMPADFDAEGLRFTCGAYGSTDGSRVQWRADGREISGSVIGSLSPYESLTVALPLPEGYYTDVSPKFNYPTVIKNGFWFFAVLLQLAGVGLWVWLGRNRRIFPPVELYPPEGVTPADVGYIFDGRVDPRDVTSLLIYWAGKGHISITEVVEKKLLKNKKTFTFTRLKPLGPEAKPYEEVMFDSLFLDFGRGGQVNTEYLQDLFYPVVRNVKRTVKQAFSKYSGNQVYASSGILAGLLLELAALLLSMLAAYILMDCPYGIGVLAAVGAGVALMVPFFFLGYLCKWWHSLSKANRDWGLLSAGVVALAFCVGATIMAPGPAERVMAGFALEGVCLLNILAFRCRRRTPLGDKYMEQLLGFRNFMVHAEKDRIEAMVEENPQYFYETLPYAMVMGVTNKWAEQFEHIAMEPPSWYYSSDPYRYSAFHVTSFTNDLDQNMNSISQSMGTQPSSGGGSGGGGFSGGGSGGGGGGSW